MEATTQTELRTIPEPCPGICVPEHWEVPRFRREEYRAKQTRYCLGVPVLNEGERLKSELRALKEVSNTIDVIIADGGSSDGSTAADILAPKGVRALLVKEGPGKLSAQLRMLFAYALDQGYDGVVTVDGNDKDDPREVTRFIEKLEAGYDYIQGSRYIPGGREENTPGERKWAVRLLHAPLISLGAGFKYSDTTNGFRAFSSGFLRDERVALFRDVFSTYNLHFHASVEAGRLGFRVTEVPVTRIYPVGEVPSKIGGFAGKARLLSQTVGAALGRYRSR